ncbi:LOW QUALITY PROTEIN: oleosin H2-like [Argentina anserina]|uniref:LOW QUALITY PROTEIN: oleosin H2-like n=1 Tax=Argentina anserina TaxID=57926 RepID=UPI0021766BF5|nr:LOW QUALITY PROTEIN: oleosin H2-like [Potentilla anserina]
MADQTKQQQLHQYGGDQQIQYSSGAKSLLPQQGPSASQVIAVVTLVPLGGTLLLLTGLTLMGTFIGMALATPLFVIFSPILVPAIVTVGLAVAGILTSGAFGITGLSSFSWLASYLRRTRLPQQAIRGVQDTTGQQKARDMGQSVTEKAHDVDQAVHGKAHEVGQSVQGKADEVTQNVQSKAQEAEHKAHETGKTHGGGRARDVKVT